jgi:hypothetical protein
MCQPKKDHQRAIDAQLIGVLELTKLFPNRAFGTVVTLSIIDRHFIRGPFCSLGAIRSRINGAWVGSVVNAHRVIDEVPLKRSS